MTPSAPKADAWIFVDDNLTAAESFRDALSGGDTPLAVRILAPSEAQKALLTGQISARGVLMDVDLSGEAGVYGTGLGLAQDIRAKQKSGNVAEFPVIRFANRAPVQKNVGGDPASDDLFDDKIEKTEVGADLGEVQRRMTAAEAIYAGLDQIEERGAEDGLLAFLGLTAAAAEDWLHPAFLSRLVDGHVQATHVAAGTFCRTCLYASGLMVDKSLLLLRLGISQTLGADQWAAVEGFARPFAYSGAGSDEMERWWARGLEEAWYGLARAEDALAMTDVEHRVAVLSDVLQIALPRHESPRTSPGSRPWRWCALNQEKAPVELVGVDPRFGVRMTARGETPPWMDPLMVSYGQAIRERDPRLNQADLVRLKSVVR